MPLSSVYFRAEDSTGSVVVRSTLPPGPLWFCCNQHIRMQRSSAPHTAGRHHGDLLSRDCIWDAVGNLLLPSSSIWPFRGARACAEHRNTFLHSRMPERAAGALLEQSWSQAHLCAANGTHNPRIKQAGRDLPHAALCPPLPWLTRALKKCYEPQSRKLPWAPGPLHWAASQQTFGARLGAPCSSTSVTYLLYFHNGK